MLILTRRIEEGLRDLSTPLRALPGAAEGFTPRQGKRPDPAQPLIL